MQSGTHGPIQAMPPESKRLLVLLETHPRSFCYYADPLSDPGTTSQVIPFDILEAAAAYARDNGMNLNFFYGESELPGTHTELIAGVPHSKIVPFPLLRQYAEHPDVAIVVNDAEVSDLERAQIDVELNLVLRVRKTAVKQLAELCLRILPKCRRLNLILLETETYSEDDYEPYQRELEKLRLYLAEDYSLGGETELSVLSDRLFLGTMRNCDAGLTHFTCSPEGRLYICPAYYAESGGRSIGDLGSGLTLTNSHLLALENAPICKRCDAFHCKRCFYLNEKLTLEINTPSKQQCILSHVERDASRKLRESLGSDASAGSLQPIPLIDYRDPFDLVAGSLTSAGQGFAPEIGWAEGNWGGEPGIKEMLYEILSVQKEILARLSAGDEKKS